MPFPLSTGPQSATLASTPTINRDLIKTGLLTPARSDFQDIFKGVAQQRAPTLPSSTPSTAPGSVSSPIAEQVVTVREGDTLVSIAKKILNSRGLDAGPHATMRAALQLAKDNRLSNANLILPGQNLSVQALLDVPRDAPREVYTGAPVNATAEPAPREAAKDTLSAERINRVQAAPPKTRTTESAHPVLEKTLDRAVHLQYISAAQKQAVRSKVLELAAEHHFAPDDLATVTLIESDGMNPRASNGRCHGIIQFCDGPNRGAASVGYKNEPRAILELSVLDQLNLVGKYFSDTGLKSFSRGKAASLDDVYLTVLTPAARRERGQDSNLDIPGRQASVLYGSNEPAASITRTTLVQGLLQNARDKLSLAIPDATSRGTAAPLKISAVDTLDKKTRF